MRVLKPAVQYRLTPDGLEEPIPPPDRSDLQSNISAGRCTDNFIGESNESSTAPHFFPPSTPHFFPPSTPRRWRTKSDNVAESPDSTNESSGIFSLASPASTSSSTFSPQSSPLQSTFPPLLQLDNYSGSQHPSPSFQNEAIRNPRQAYPPPEFLHQTSSYSSLPSTHDGHGATLSRTCRHIQPPVSSESNILMDYVAYPHRASTGHQASSQAALNPTHQEMLNNVMQRPGRISDPFLTPANAVIASYWKELQRLFPSVPSSGVTWKRSTYSPNVEGVEESPLEFSSEFSSEFCPQTSPSAKTINLPSLSPSTPLPPFIDSAPQWNSSSGLEPTSGRFDASEQSSRTSPSETATVVTSSSSSTCHSPSLAGDGNNLEIRPSCLSPPSSTFSSLPAPTLVVGVEKLMQPLAMHTATKVRMANREAAAKSFNKNGRSVPFDEIDAKIMHNRRSLLGLPEDDFFTRSVAVTEMVRPSQRLGINSKEQWSQFRRQSECNPAPSENSMVVCSDPTRSFSSNADENHYEVGSGLSNARGFAARRSQRPSRRTSLTSISSDHSSLASTGKKCNFCFNNKEPIEVWSSHDLKDERTGKIACTILRKYVCPRCGATGDNAHTNRYCPRNKSEDGKTTVSSIKDLTTGRTSAGRFSMNSGSRNC